MAGPELFGVIVLGSTAALLIVCFILYAILARRRHFRCPKCGARFKVPASSSFFAPRDGTDKRLTCPSCGYFGFMEDRRDAAEEPELPDGEPEAKDSEPALSGEDGPRKDL